ncbi:DUF5320 domain-containing protein [Lutispora sp.]|uniref:DUF5320 domain-containing protein n=1 Tax=Lutispora sp. TaxID=2828727 RepID=UPI0035689BBA
MPGRDGTGPLGMGTLTGRGAGLCSGVYAGYGMGFGRGRGYRRRAYFAYTPIAETSADVYGGAFMPPVDEKQYLTREAEILKNRLHEVDKRLKEINEGSDK